MIYYNSEHCTINYFEKEKLVFTRYHGFTPSEELRKILDIMLKLLSEKEVELSLSDRRQMKVIRPADQEYINTVWFPKFLSLAKIKRSATVESTDFFNKMSVDKILKTVGDKLPFQIHTFDSLENACRWLNVDPKLIEE